MSYGLMDELWAVYCKYCRENWIIIIPGMQLLVVHSVTNSSFWSNNKQFEFCFRMCSGSAWAGAWHFSSPVSSWHSASIRSTARRTIPPMATARASTTREYSPRLVFHYSDISWASWHLKSQANWLFNGVFRFTTKRSIKALHYWPFVRGIHR